MNELRRGKRGVIRKCGCLLLAFLLWIPPVAAFAKSDGVLDEIFIRIKMSKEENTTVYGRTEFLMNIEEYLRGVVPSEIYESTHIEALKAQAIAARTYAYARRDRVVTDGINSQTFHYLKMDNTPRSRQAIEDTAGMVLTYNGKVIDCFFSATNSGITKRSGDVWMTNYPYYVSKRDEWDEKYRESVDSAMSGHGVGMSQCGAMWAANHGFTYQEILAFYFEGCSISYNYGIR